MDQDHTNSAGENTKFELSHNDQQALDALVEAGFDNKLVESSLGDETQRVEVVSHLFGLMNDYPVDDDSLETLVDATMAGIHREEQALADRMSFHSQQQSSERHRSRFYLPNFISVAAVILIAVGVFWPLLSTMRARAIDASCSNNLRLLGYAFGQYASDHNGALPVAVAGAGSGSWDTVRNALNLTPLVNGNYCEVGHLECPGHHDHVGPSYSYRWFLPGQMVAWETGQVTVVIGDLNPVIEAARLGRLVPPLSISINHAGRGQNVLASDGGTLWLVEPVVGRSDNIWLPNGAKALQPGTTPTDAGDVFLAH